MRISDWSSDVCSSDLGAGRASAALDGQVCKLMDGRQPRADRLARDGRADDADDRGMRLRPDAPDVEVGDPRVARILDQRADFCRDMRVGAVERSEEHTSELQSLMRISYAVFCLKKKHKTRM